jgi:anaerobic magnesium-protoporphyrin IX monomethyl ester cyclase
MRRLIPGAIAGCRGEPIDRALSGEATVRILLINPPYQTLTSTWGVGHQVPLGLPAVGGPLLDAGHAVSLLDASSSGDSSRAAMLARILPRLPIWCG